MILTIYEWCTSLLCGIPALKEHIETGYCNTLASLIRSSTCGLYVFPVVTSTGIQEDGHEEKVNQSTRELLVVASTLLPFSQQIANSRHAANFEMLPSAVRWDGVELVWSIVALVGEMRW